MNFVLSSFYITIGVYVLAVVIILSILTVSKHKLRLTLLLTLCTIGIVFQYITVQLLVTDELAQAVEMRRWRHLFVAIYMPVLLAFLATYLNIRRYRAHLTLFSIAAAILAIANLVLPYGIRFVALPELLNAEVQGMTFYYLSGPSHIWNSLWYSYLLTGFLCALYLAAKISVRDKLIAMGLFAYVLIQLLTTAVNIHSAMDILYIVQTDGFAILVLIVVACVGVTLDYLRSNQNLTHLTYRLQDEAREKSQLEDEKMILARIVEEEPYATHIINASGQVIQCNNASREFWQQDISQTHFNLLEFVRIACQKNNQAFDLSAEQVNFAELKITSGLGFFLPQGSSVSWLAISIFRLSELTGEEKFCIRLRDISEQKTVELAIKKVASAVAHNWGKQFYKQMVKTLNETFSSDYAIISRCKEGTDEMQTVAVAHQQSIIDNFSYSLPGTPCEKTLSRGICLYSNNIQTTFPNDKMLRDINVNGYLGAAIHGSEEEFIGVLVVMSVEPLMVPGNLTELLDLFVARTSAEFQLKHAEQKIRKIAYYDYLTELPNRANLLERLTSKLDSLTENCHSAVFLVDLDNFKFINDSLGNDVADQVLRVVARRLKEMQQVISARYGGDEFVLVSDKKPLNKIEDYARLESQNIIRYLEKPIQIGELIVNISASVGTCIFPLQSTDRLEILRYAETALLQSKKLGKGVGHLFDPIIQQRIEEKMALQQALQTAITQQELSLVIQPQIREHSNIVWGEVLLRWQNEDGHMISPAVFIPLAEETGMIHALGDWVIEQTLVLLKNWQALERLGGLSINVSAWQFADNDFIFKLLKKVQEYQVEPRRLTLELTETSLLQDIEEAKLKLKQLQSSGFKISLDDFGTGYSSLSYLRELPLDELKIDKSFVDEIDGKRHTPLVESIVSIAKHLNLEVLAEGVETEQQYQALFAMGCHAYQGYYFAKPLAIDAFEDALKNQA